MITKHQVLELVKGRDKANCVVLFNYTDWTVLFKDRHGVQFIKGLPKLECYLNDATRYPRLMDKKKYYKTLSLIGYVP